MKKYIKKSSQIFLFILFIMGALSHRGQVDSRAFKEDTKENRYIYTQKLMPDVYGYAGEIPIVITIDKNDIISEIKILPNDETPSFIRTIEKKKYLDNWIGLSVKEAANKEVDTITRATMSTNAIRTVIKGSLEKFSNTHTNSTTQKTKKVHFNKIKAVPAFFVLLLAVFLIFKKKKNKYFRIFYQIINIIIIGFWANYFISLSLLCSWVKGQLNPFTYPVLLFLILTVVFSFFGKKQFYCSYICPYGAFQELLYKILPKKFKLKINRKLLKIMLLLKYLILSAIILFMWIGAGEKVIGYEPFSAFLFLKADKVVIFTAVFGLVLSFFIMRPWCRFFCPTGALLRCVEK